MSEVAKQVMSERDARRVTERIRIVAHNYTEAKAKLIQLVQEAKDGNAHEALGYPSWTAYLAETLGDEPMRLARDERQEMVKVLSAEGMSTRAIAPIVGTSYQQVSKDRRAQVSPEATPEPKSDAELLAGAEWSPESVEDAPRFTDEPGRVQPVTGTITGMDGKTYTRPQPKDPVDRRPPLPEQIFNAVYDLGKVVDRLERLVEDDRFNRIKEEVASKHESDLNRNIDALHGIINRFSN